MSAPNELRVFISSTFRDLQEEREHLVKKIFPEIRALCRERGITFTEVDLRWGLTDEQLALGQVIRTCLEEIDKCRPYFIGITGERYGYVPELAEYYKDADLLAKYQWLEDAAMEGSSIIDLEFRHAALNSPEEIRASAAFFFRRSRYGVESDIDAREAAALAALQQRVRGAGMRIEEFRDPASLGEMIYDELRRIIDRDFATAAPPTPLEEERSRHRAFAESRRHAYIPNADYLTDLNAWFAEADTLPLVIYAESGSGKSSLVSFWCEQLRRRRIELPVVEHYVGIGAGDADHLGIMRHVMEEIRELFARSDEIPSKPEDIEREFANWLGFTVGRPLLLVIDGINQLTGRALDLHWLPPIMPEGVKLIITSTVEQTLIDLRGRGWPTMGMQPLREKEREAVVVRYLSEYRKALSKEQVSRIAGDVKCAHPLFLRTLLEELRLDSSHEQLDARIERYLRTTGTEDLFQQVLERMEDDYGTRAVREVMSLIFCSRRGLDETELAELTGIGRLKLSTMLSGLDYHLVGKEGVLTFFHDYLRRAVEKRYLNKPASRQERYQQLATHFERAETTLRATLELLHALEKLGDREGLNAALSDIARFVKVWETDEYEILRLSTERDLTELTTAYEAGLDRWEASQRTDDERIVVLQAVGKLYERVGALRASEVIAHKQLAIARAGADRGLEAETLVFLGWLAMRLGRRVEAESLTREAEEIARVVMDRERVGNAIGVRGLVHSERGEYNEALACFSEQDQIARELGDRRRVALVAGYRGIVHAGRGEYSEALMCYREEEAVARELGDRAVVGHALGNRVNVHVWRGEYAEALACCSECAELFRAVGDRQGIAAAVGNRGSVHLSRGECAEALACYAEQEEIVRELGDRIGIAVAVGNRGVVHFRRGQDADALSCFTEWERIARELGDRANVAAAVANRGVVSMNRGDYIEALACFAEQEVIANELGDRRTIALAAGNRGLVHGRRGEYAEALTCFLQAATQSRAIGNRLSLAFSLGGAADALVEFAEHEQCAPPEYLQECVILKMGTEFNHLASADRIANRRTAALHVGRTLAEECVALCEELSDSGMLFSGQVLLARITAAEGDPASALATLRTILDGAADDYQRVELHYWLWKLGADDRDHRTEALRRYRLLVEKTPRWHYRERIEELEAGA